MTILEASAETYHADCGRGHEFTPENTYRSPQGRGRTCRRCHADYEYDRRRRLGLVA